MKYSCVKPKNSSHLLSIPALNYKFGKYKVPVNLSPSLVYGPYRERETSPKSPRVRHTQSADVNSSQGRPGNVLNSQSWFSLFFTHSL